METLRVKETVLAEPLQIHRQLTSNFRLWFSDPKPWQTWTVHPDKQDFLKHYEETRIPAKVLGTLWESLRRKAEPDEDLANTPTFEEFSKAIDHMKKDSAPGMSGLSYNMMRVWDEKIRRRIYDEICALWEQGQFPKEWERRWIVPIPKKEDPDIGDLRPLMLMEALRKVWGTIFVRRIQEKWKNTNLLRPNLVAYQGRN
jgi:hypothetical protein